LSSKVPGRPGTVLSRDLLNGPVAFLLAGVGCAGASGAVVAGGVGVVAPERFHSWPTMSRASLASGL
jgi:hypothetical protein